MEHCQVRVQEGILQGKECKTFYGKRYYSFEGIPYAKPPIGRLRFRNPEPPEPWTGILDATKPGNIAIQSNPYSNTPIEGSEDCLYLNIYTPVLPAEKLQNLPVILFIHGGRLIFGWSHYYSPDYIIKHDVILVTVNYRLNILGWLCLNIPECPGNAGLKDVAMALKWLNKNVSYFNGDKNNITLAGESAGAGIVTSFLTSKMAAGLYSKIIAISGNLLSDLYLILQDSVKKASAVAAILGKQLTDARDLYEFLIEVPVNDLLEAFTEVELSRPRSIVNAYFLPVVEKKFDGVEAFFTELPYVAIRENRFHKVPMLTALNSHEGALFFIENGNIIYENDFYYFIPQQAKIKKGTPKAKRIEDKIRKFYLGDRSLGDGVKKEYVEMVSDVYFWRDIILFAEEVSKYWDQMYLLHFEYMGGMNTRIMKSIGIKGTTHGDIIQYQFYRKSKALKATNDDKKIVLLLNEMFYNFAKTGKPTWTNQTTEWLPYTNSKQTTLVVNDNLKVVNNFYGKERFKFWMDLAKEYPDTPSKL